MAKENKNLVLILLILAVFTGMAIEINEGSTVAGLFLFLCLVFLLTRIDFNQLASLSLFKKSRTYTLVGILILGVDLFYNIKTCGKLGTLDVMTVFFSFSLIGTQLRSTDIIRVSKFGIYISSVFIVLYLIFYTTLSFLNIKFMSSFNHYLILLPTVWVVSLAGVPLEIVTTETVLVSGVEKMLVVINGPCSGLYSMFLFIGIVVGYSKIEKMDRDRTLKTFGLCIAIAYVSNLFRIMIIYLTAYLYGREAMMTVHTHIGWIIFVGVAILIFLLLSRKNDL